VEKLIITAAVVGAELTRADTPYLPLTPEEIAMEACACCQAGASILHLHARDAEGNPTQDANIYRRIISLIQTECDPIIQVSTGGAIGMTAEERLHPLRLNPEMASLTVGTVNFGNGVFYNPPDFLIRLASMIKEYGIKPELEIFDAGMVANALWLERKGFLIPPLHFDLVLGVRGGLPATVKNLLFILDLIPPNSTWSVAGIGRQQLPMAVAAILTGGHVRVGLEDNIYYRSGEYATGNVPLVERVVRLAQELDREVAKPDEARDILGLRR
jgi:3-keto-5-aminohexanoate cleavage enzyme